MEYSIIFVVYILSMSFGFPSLKLLSEHLNATLTAEVPRPVFRVYMQGHLSPTIRSPCIETFCIQKAVEYYMK